MGVHLYKYIGGSYLARVFERRNYLTLKCSRPKDFNDPYELFLTIDFRVRPEVLAFYAEVVGKMPQYPVTCFSRSPANVPMWAHYAENLTGVVLEFDEKALASEFKGAAFGNITYRDRPPVGWRETLYRAYAIGKFRYLYFLRQGVFSAAYYSKATCWKYEQERRMILEDADVREQAELLLVDIPRRCLTAIYCGPRASKATLEAAAEKADICRIPLYRMNIGQTTTKPFFTNDSSDVFVHGSNGLEMASNPCNSCREPLSGSKKRLCSWCQIGDHHKRQAASRNTFRMLAHYGILDDYLDNMDDIGRKLRDDVA